jgi:hypothetical protein
VVSGFAPPRSPDSCWRIAAANSSAICSLDMRRPRESAWEGSKRDCVAIVIAWHVRRKCGEAARSARCEGMVRWSVKPLRRSEESAIGPNGWRSLLRHVTARRTAIRESSLNLTFGRIWAN